MEHYVTLFDSLFLPQGLALHISMEKHVKNYTLWILCVDDEVFFNLTKIGLNKVRLLQLSKLETSELLQVKKIRSKGEYCWTLTPFAPRFVFESDSSVQRVTYIDADMWFRKNPWPIFQEFEESGKSVLITDHAYAPEYDQSATSGQFCVQFMTFCRDSSECVRKWWEERCIAWCYARYEDGKFGDQKYLDEWPDIFSDYVHVLKQEHFFLAPWNAKRFAYNNSIVYHFQELRIGKKIQLYRSYQIPDVVIVNIYEKYLNDINKSIKLLKMYNIQINEQLKKKCLKDQFKKYFHGFRQNIWRFVTCRSRDLY